jgi:hypothetical protein
VVVVAPALAGALLLPEHEVSKAAAQNKGR